MMGNTLKRMKVGNSMSTSSSYMPKWSGLVLRGSRKGFQEERDSHRLKDRGSRPIACYACNGSSIPLRSLTTDPGSSWRSIVSCDYCSLSWHLDCLNPPLAVTPNSGKKWMCPNHAEQVMVCPLLNSVFRFIGMRL